MIAGSYMLRVSDNVVIDFKSNDVVRKDQPLSIYLYKQVGNKITQGGGNGNVKPNLAEKFLEKYKIFKNQKVDNTNTSTDYTKIDALWNGPCINLKNIAMIVQPDGGLALGAQPKEQELNYLQLMFPYTIKYNSELMMYKLKESEPNSKAFIHVPSKGVIMFEPSFEPSQDENHQVNVICDPLNADTFFSGMCATYPESFKELGAPVREFHTTHYNKCAHVFLYNQHSKVYNMYVYAPYDLLKGDDEMKSNLLHHLSLPSDLEVADLKVKDTTVKLRNPVSPQANNFTTFQYNTQGGNVSKPDKIHILGRDRLIRKVGRKKMITYKGEQISLTAARALEKAQLRDRVPARRF
jgi:hypothetical protein